MHIYGIYIAYIHREKEAALWHTVSFDKGCYVGQASLLTIYLPTYLSIHLSTYLYSTYIQQIYLYM